MANKVLLKKSSVTAKVPQVTDLDYGELAINYADGKLYFKNAQNQIDFFNAFSAGVSVNSFSTISVVGQTNVIADSATDTLSFEGRGLIDIATDATTDTIRFGLANAVSFTLQDGTEQFIKLRVDSGDFLLEDLTANVYLPFVTADGVEHKFKIVTA